MDKTRLKARRRKTWKGKGIQRPDDTVMTGGRSSDVVIPVMGHTGVGKSTIINTLLSRSGAVSANNVASVGHDLRSHTARIEHFVIPHTKDTSRRIVFVDTPGFDDTYIDDSEILRRIAVWLAKSYSDDMKLAGVVYLHEISQPRMMGAPRRNLEMFSQLCGESAMRNVILVTTKWEEVSPDLGERRERQLRDNYWKRMLELGSQMLRFHSQHDHSSAWDIVNRILGNQPVDALQIQEEMVDLQRTIPETSAGRALRATLKELLVAREQMGEKLKEKGAENDERLRQAVDENKRTIDSISKQIRGLKIPMMKRIAGFLRSQ